ncbi:MAG: methyltransferase domain-containing protein [Pseudomonadota bacterium]
MKNHYTIEGKNADINRLGYFEDTFDHHSLKFLQQCGLKPGLSVLDVGCGIGSITCKIADIVGKQGKVVAIDQNHERLDQAKKRARAQGIHNIEFICSDINQYDLPHGFDFIYTRFLLMHLSIAAACIAKFYTALAKGGRLIVEDADFSGSFHYPPNAAFSEGMSLLTTTYCKTGGDPDIGLKLPCLLRQQQFTDLKIHCYNQMTLTTPKTFLHLTLDNMRQSILAHTECSDEKLSSVIDDIDAYQADPNTLLSPVRVFQIGGLKIGRVTN